VLRLIGLGNIGAPVCRHLPEAGVVVFQESFEAWRKVTGAEGIEPSVEVFQGGSGSC